MDWSNERYVRVYTRDTADWSCLSWQARALWLMIVRKLDRSGVLSTNKGARGVAALVVMPLDVVEPALAELLDDGCLVASESGYTAPNYLAAQEAKQSDRQRAKESRGRRRDVELGVTPCDADDHAVTERDASVTAGHAPSRAVTKRDDDITNRDANVTRGHTESHAVTSCHSEPSLAVPSRSRSEAPSADRPSRKKPALPLPENWAPTPEHQALARAENRDVAREAARFRDWASANAEAKSDWDAAFRNWLRSSFGNASPKAAGLFGGTQSAPPRRIERL